MTIGTRDTEAFCPVSPVEGAGRDLRPSRCLVLPAAPASPPAFPCRWKGISVAQMVMQRCFAACFGARAAHGTMGDVGVRVAGSHHLPRAAAGGWGRHPPPLPPHPSPPPADPRSPCAGRGCVPVVLGLRRVRAATSFGCQGCSPVLCHVSAVVLFCFFLRTPKH